MISLMRKPNFRSECATCLTHRALAIPSRRMATLRPPFIRSVDSAGLRYPFRSIFNFYLLILISAVADVVEMEAAGVWKKAGSFNQEISLRLCLDQGEKW